MKHILAIDLGTQSIRAGLMTPEGRAAAVSQEAHTIGSPLPGWAQQNPAEWWEIARKLIQEVIGKSGINPADIAVVIACGQMHGPTGISRNGDITTGLTQLWCDKRCETQCIELRRTFGDEHLQQIAGNIPGTGWTGLKVRWIKENMPEAYEKTTCFLVPKDFINYMLTGVFATDFSEASGSFLLDAAKEGYSGIMAERLGLDLDKFPPLFRSHDIIGRVKKDAAMHTGLVEGTPVMAGGGDFLISLLSLGLTDSATAVDMTGTSTLFVVEKDSPVIHPSVSNLMHALGGWAPFVMLDTGGLNMKWLRDFLSSAAGAPVSYDNMIEQAEAVPAGSDGLLFYPYLLGERRSDNVNSKGMFSGITPGHTAGHFARAVMEGTALALGMNAAVFRSLGVRIDRVCCVGGATRNRLLNRIKANIYGVPVEISDEPEATLAGAGLLGAYGLGLISDIAETAARLHSRKTIIHPDEKTTKVYVKMSEEFERLYGHMLGFWK
jgi:xylulokinase